MQQQVSRLPFCTCIYGIVKPHSRLCWNCMSDENRLNSIYSTHSPPPPPQKKPHQHLTDVLHTHRHTLQPDHSMKNSADTFSYFCNILKTTLLHSPSCGFLVLQDKRRLYMLIFNTQSTTEVNPGVVKHFNRSLSNQTERKEDNKNLIKFRQVHVSELWLYEQLICSLLIWYILIWFERTWCHFNRSKTTFTLIFFND